MPRRPARPSPRAKCTARKDCLSGRVCRRAVDGEQYTALPTTYPHLLGGDLPRYGAQSVKETQLERCSREDRSLRHVFISYNHLCLCPGNIVALEHLQQQRNHSTPQHVYTMLGVLVVLACTVCNKITDTLTHCLKIDDNLIQIHSTCHKDGYMCASIHTYI